MLVSVPVGLHPFADRFGGFFQRRGHRATVVTRPLLERILVGVLVAHIPPIAAFLRLLAGPYLLFKTHLLRLELR